MRGRIKPQATYSVSMKGRPYHIPFSYHSPLHILLTGEMPVMANFATERLEKGQFQGISDHPSGGVTAV